MLDAVEYFWLPEPLFAAAALVANLSINAVFLLPEVAAAWAGSRAFDILAILLAARVNSLYVSYRLKFLDIVAISVPIGSHESTVWPIYVLCCKLERKGS